MTYTLLRAVRVDGYGLLYRSILNASDINEITKKFKSMVMNGTPTDDLHIIADLKYEVTVGVELTDRVEGCV